MHIVCLEILKFVEKADRIVLIINLNKNIGLSSFETGTVYMYLSHFCARDNMCAKVKVVLLGFYVLNLCIFVHFFKIILRRSLDILNKVSLHYVYLF